MSEPVESGGWETLRTTARWNAEQYELERTTDPVACPAHGDPLESHNGKLHCPMGHFVQKA